DGDGNIKDFPGNYSIYRNWADEQEELRKQEAAQEKPKPIENKAPKKNTAKLSFNEKREFEQLELELPKLEEEKEALETAMNSGELTPQELLEKSERYAILKDELDEKEMRWLELSEKG
ncbi:MAG: ABC transporter C-terminal domain-containing protein, partial [Mangrovibacterium sp.]